MGRSQLIQQPLAAALGVDLPINSPSGNMVVSLGGGSTQAAVLAMYGIVTAETLRMALAKQSEVALRYYLTERFVLRAAAPSDIDALERMARASAAAEEPSPLPMGMSLLTSSSIIGMGRPACSATWRAVCQMRLLAPGEIICASRPEGRICNCSAGRKRHVLVRAQ